MERIKIQVKYKLGAKIQVIHVMQVRLWITVVRDWRKNKSKMLVSKFAKAGEMN